VCCYSPSARCTRVVGDKHRSERVFSVGDWVYLKLQLYAQSSVMPRVNQKLRCKYFGPFEVLEKVGADAYHLKPLDSSSIHHVVHVSQLELAVSTELHSDLSYRVPVKVISSRLVNRGGAQVLIQ
jgi:hypothetical protein